MEGLRLRKHLRKLLSETLLPEEMVYVCNSYDVVGDIAIVRLSEASRNYGQAIAESITRVHKNVKTVLAQTSPVQGDFRLRKFEYLAGENKTTAVHKESGCLFLVDVAECYFSPRLSYERTRIAKQVRNGEIVVNMFAGVGCFSIVIAKHSNAEKIYSIDVNPKAVEYMRENVRLNRVYGRVISILGDAKEIIEEKLRNAADRVLMPLSEKASEYLPYALATLKKGRGWIHYYDFEHAKRNTLVEKVTRKVTERLEKLDAVFEIASARVVRTTGPNWYQVVLDIAVER